MFCGLREYILVHCETRGIEVGVNFFLMYKMRMHFGTEGTHLSQQFLRYSTQHKNNIMYAELTPKLACLIETGGIPPC